MALELRQNLKLSQQLVMTPQLQQAIKLLQLSRLELVETVNQELEDNPILELNQAEDESDRDEEGAPFPEKPGVETKENDFSEVRIEETPRNDIDWENYLGEYSSTPALPNMYETPAETPSYENFVANKTTLTEHLGWQLRMSKANEKENRIGAQIIGNLNSDGYLMATVEEISALEKVPVEQVEHVLSLVQELDPVGIAARDLKECLLIQLRHLGLADSLPAKIVANHLKDLENKNYLKIARHHKVTKETVFAAETIILNLDPRPGRAYAPDEPIYITPDVFVFKFGDDYMVVLNDDGLPKLKISQYFRDMLTAQNTLPAQTKEYVKGKMSSAMWLIRSIHQRQRTIYRVTESIMRFQRDFLDKGVEYLKPLVLRDVAEDVQMHESTISRVTTNKYVHTPQGLYELKFFFDSPVNRFFGESLASESVKKRIKQIIAAEDPHKPLSDQRIAEILRGANIDIARRTVAKYREMLSIAPSSKRKKHY